MYIPKSFVNNNLEQLHQLIEKFNFATLISHSNDEFQTTHIPLMLNKTQGQYGTLLGHMAKLNPHLNAFDGNTNTLCIFHGPHSYISPTWYKTSPSVPTWNYVVVHAYGNPVLISQAQLSDDLTRMVQEHEATISNTENYVIPEVYKSKLLDHIVGFKIEILRIEGKYKLGQNRSQADQSSLIEGLLKQNTTESTTLADFIQSLPAKTCNKGSLE